MGAFWIAMLIGLAVGAGLTAGYIFAEYHVQTKEAWKESRINLDAIVSRMHKLVAENAKLRVAPATGLMSEDARKVAAVTMAALDAVIDTGKVNMEECDAFTHPLLIEDRIKAATEKRSPSEIFATADPVA